LFQHAPGIPKVLVGNRLHLAFRRQVDPMEAEEYAERNSMGFFEASPLVNFNVAESFVELARDQFYETPFWPKTFQIHFSSS
jgi:hypothetical protein